jgi:hypothetical protein
MEPTKKTNSFLEVIILEPESDVIHTCLGITDERKDVLSDFLQNNVLKDLKNEQKTTITDDLHKISINSKHANELVWMVFQYGTNLGYNEGINKAIKTSSNPLASGDISDFLKFLLEQGKKNKDSDEESDDNSDSE